MNIRLYDEDHYLKEFDAKVISIDRNQVELEQTAFFAEGGGQTGDTGFLNREKVVSTKYLDEKHVHIMENEPGFRVGETVHGVIDWNRRYKIMKLHTASHIMEYYLWKHFGYMKRTGSKVDEIKDRADYEYNERLDPNILKKVEDETNKFLAEGYPVTIIVDESGIRTWRCGSVEMQCAGTHVKNTSEIGAITLRRKNPGRNEERVDTARARSLKE